MMMKTTLALLVGGLALAAAPLALADQPAATAAGSAPAKPAASRFDDKAMICRREETTGTRLGAKTVCLTRGEWTAMAAQARDAVDHGQNLSRTYAPPGH